MEDLELQLFELKKAKELALKMYAKQSYSEASKLFLRSADLAKELEETNLFMVRSWTKAAKCSLKLGQPTKGLVLLEKSLKAVEKLVSSDTHELAAPIWKNMGLCYEAIGDWEEAKNAIEKAISIRKAFIKREHPSFFTFYTKLGFYMFKLEEYSSASSQYKEAIDIGKSIGLSSRVLFGVYSNAGSTFEKMGALKQASEMYRLAIECAKEADLFETQSQEAGVALYKQGSLFLKQKQPSEAIKCLEEGLRLVGEADDLGNARAHILVNLASGLLESGELEKAEITLSELLRKYESVEKGINEFCGLGHYLQGVLLGKKGNNQEAYASFEKSLSIMNKITELPIDKEILKKIQEGMRLFSAFK